MTNVITQLRAIVAAILAWPVIAPLLEVFDHRSTITLLLGFLSYVLVMQVEAIPAGYRHYVADAAFFGFGLLTGRFTLEGLMTAHANLPKTPGDYGRAIAAEIISPTSDNLTVVNVATAPPVPEQVGGQG